MQYSHNKVNLTLFKVVLTFNAFKHYIAISMLNILIAIHVLIILYIYS